MALSSLFLFVFQTATNSNFRISDVLRTYADVFGKGPPSTVPQGPASTRHAMVSQGKSTEASAPRAEVQRRRKHGRRRGLPSARHPTVLFTLSLVCAVHGQKRTWTLWILETRFARQALSKPDSASLRPDVQGWNLLHSLQAAWPKAPTPWLLRASRGLRSDALALLAARRENVVFARKPP